MATTIIIGFLGRVESGIEYISCAWNVSHEKLSVTPPILQIHE